MNLRHSNAIEHYRPGLLRRAGILLRDLWRFLAARRPEL